MNKKYLLTALLVMLTIMLFSLPVSESQVRKVAQNLSMERNGQISRISSISMINPNASSRIYIANLAPQGFVIVAGDDASRPILGYSFANIWTGDNIPVQLQDLIDSWTAQLKYITENQLVADNNIRTEWQRFDIETSQFTPIRNDRAVAPLLSSLWGQGTYYNALCPASTPVGCVATAMTQIMKYWSFPTTGLGSHSYTPSSHPSYGVQTANFGTTTYNWAGMPNSVTSANTSVATLCYQAGVSVNMDYDPTGSGAFSTDVPGALVNYFRYKNTAQIYNKSSYSTDTWDTMMRGELDNARPVYYSGSGPAGGHAFILDGYTGTNSFHLNWGWDGWYNGYYTLAALNPGSDTFNSGQQAVIGIKPSETYATLSEGFEGTTFPPTGWTVTASTFVRSATSFITGAYSARYSVTATGAAASGKQLRTMKLTVNATSAPITFKAKRGTNARGEELKVGYSTSATGPFTYFGTNAALTATATTYTYAVTSLTPGDYYFVFETYATTASNAKVWYIDDVTGPTKWVDPNPIAAINITSWSAGALAPGGAAQSGLTFQLSNVAQGTLTITNVTNLSATEFRSSLNTSVALVAGQVHEFGFTYEPLNYGTDNQSYVITTNGGTITITLSGSAIYSKFSDGFETYTNFALAMSPWTQSDIDLLPTYGVTGYTWLNTGYTGAYMAFNPYATTPAMGTGWEAHTGQKYATCWAGIPTATVTANNDWLITPLVTVTTGGTVSFWAKAYTATYPEAFKVRTSTTTNATTAFTTYLAGSASTSVAPTTTWTLYSYSLPTNFSGYIAIQCVSADAFAFMVDDFTVTDASTPPAPPDFGNVSGYVYRSGTSIPIANALVTAGSKTAYTNAAGFYQINNLVVGTYAMSSSATGQFFFDANQSGVVITVGNTTSQNFSMTWSEITANPMTFSASVYTSETSTQNLAISNPGGTANLQYSMWLSTAAASNRNNASCSKKLPATATQNTHPFKSLVAPEIDRSEGWMGYTSVSDANYYTGAVTERATKFYIEEFGLWSQGVTISKLRHWFYELSTDLWGTNTTFIFKIYADNGTTVLYTSPSITANRYPVVTEHILTTPLTVTSNFYVSVIPVDATTGKPQSLGTDVSVGNSWYGSSAAWTAMTLDLCLDAYVQGSEWISAGQYSGTVAPAATQNVSMLFDSNGLTAGTKTAYLNISNNANYSSPSTRGDLMVIPISLTVTVPPVPFVTLNTNVWNPNTVVGTPVNSGSVFTISNVGTGTLTITSISGLTGTPFTTNFNTATTLALGASYSFYLLYTPTVPGLNTATFTIVTNGGTKTITISAYAVGTTYQAESFEGATFPPAGWLSYDVDADTHNWLAYSATGAAHTGTIAAGSNSWISARNETSRNDTRPALTPNNWLVTPRLAVGPTGVLAYWIAAQDPDWPAEHYSVMVSTTNNQVASFTTELFTETLVDGDWHQRVLNLSAYANQNIYLAFRHHSCTDQFVLKLDDVQMPPLAAPLVYGSISGTVRRMVTNAVIEGVSVTVAGQTTTTDVNGAYALSNIVAETYQMTCSKTGYQSKSVSVTIPGNSTLHQNVSLEWGDVVASPTAFTESQEVETSHAYPFSFNNPGTYPVIWETASGAWGGDALLGPALNEDFETFAYTGWSGFIGPNTEVYAGYGHTVAPAMHAFVFESEHCSSYQWLITPKLSVQASDNLNFWYMQFNDTAEGLDVLVSTTTTDTTAFGTSLSHLGPMSGTAWTNFNASLAAYAGQEIYIAFKYTKQLTQYAYVMLDDLTGPAAYIAPENWLSCPDLTGTLAAGASLDSQLEINTAGMVPGHYTAKTWILTDGVTSPVALSVDLTVTHVLDATVPADITISRASLENLNVQIGWSASAHAARYHVYACATPLAFDQYVHITTTTGLSAVITPEELAAAGVTGNEACFRVTADNAARSIASVSRAEHRTSATLYKIKAHGNSKGSALKRM